MNEPVGGANKMNLTLTSWSEFSQPSVTLNGCCGSFCHLDWSEALISVKHGIHGIGLRVRNF